MIDPKKLEAFAGGGGKPPKPAPEEGGGEEDLEEGEGEGGEEEAEDRNLDMLIQLIEEYKDDVEQCVDELDGQALADPQADLEPEDQQIFKEGVDNLDDHLKEEMSEVLPGMEFEACQELADQLDAQGVLSSTPERVAGWLFRIGQTMKGPKAEPEDGEGDGEGEGDGGENEPPKKGQKPQD